MLRCEIDKWFEDNLKICTAYTYNQTGDWSYSEEVVSKAAQTTYKKLEKEKIDHINAFVYKCIKNTLRWDRWRTAHSRILYVDSNILETVDFTPKYTQLFCHAEEEDIHVLLDRFIDKYLCKSVKVHQGATRTFRIDSKGRQLLHLVVAGYSIAEIANMLDMCNRAVSMRLSNYRKRFRNETSYEILSLVI